MKVNQIKAGVVLSYLSLAFKVIINLVYTPILLRLVGTNEYGVYSTCSSVIGYLSVLSFGFGSAYIKFYSQYKVKDDYKMIKKLNGMFVTIFTIIAVIVIIIGGWMTFNARFVLGNKISDAELKLAQVLLAIMCFNLAVSMPKSVFSAFITSREKFLFQRGIDFLITVANPIITIPLLYLGYKTIAVVTVVTSLTLITFFVDIFYCLKFLKIEFDFKGFDVKLFKGMFGFSAFIFLQMLMDQINWQVDKFILIRVIGSEAVAVYTIGSQINTYYLQFCGCISNVFTPRVHSLVNNNDAEGINKLFVKVSRVQFFIAWMVFIGFCLFGKDFIKLWAGSQFKNAYWIGILLILPIVLSLSENIGIEIMRAKNLHGKLNFIYFIICISNIIITIPLCYKLGEIGSALGTFITLFVGQVLVLNLYYYKIANIDVICFLKNVAMIVLKLLPTVIFGCFISWKVDVTNWIYMFLVCIIYALIYFLNAWFLAFTQEDKKMIYNFLHKIRKVKK